MKLLRHGPIGAKKPASTPEGVDLGMKPTSGYLKRSDVMLVDGGVLGAQRQVVC